MRFCIKVTNKIDQVSASMSVQFKQFAPLADDRALATASHVLLVLPSNKPASVPFAHVLESRLKRSRSKYADLAKTPLTTDLPNGGLASWLVLETSLTPFQRHTLLRKALQPLLDEKPQSLTIAVFGQDKMRQQSARDAFYVACTNAAELPVRKGSEAKAKHKPRALKTIRLHGWQQQDGFAEVMAQVAGNALTRQLTMLPPNDLTPTSYREKIEKLARQEGWKHEQYDMRKLKKLGAGAFVAVGQGSEPQDAAIVHLSYSPRPLQTEALSSKADKAIAKNAVSKKQLKTLALIGKGICFDTGGHNLKPAKYMSGMHEDMNGSAVALGILLAASRANLPLRIDCWLAIAQNHIGPLAYKQNDVVTALNGTTIEIVHTDAEGRMVLADTLTLASRAKPDFMLDFATLTGSMVAALGDRYSGVLGNRPAWLAQAVEAGVAAGERVCSFPFDQDYEEELDSSIADIKQCTLEGGADHVLAARFLSRFISGDVPWVHVDLSSASRKGGLGAVASDVTGFGVGWGLEMIRRVMRHPTLK